MTDPAPQNTARPVEPAEIAARLRQAAHESGVQFGDPLGPLVEVFAKLLVWLGRWEAHFDARASATLRQLETEADESAAMLSGMAASRSEATESDIQRAATRAAEMTVEAVLKAAPGRARPIVIFVLGVSLAFGLGGAIGYGRAAKSSTETLAAVAALQGALLGRPDDLGLWTDLLQRNDVRNILNSCAQPGHMTVTATGRVCLAPVRIDGPPDAPP